MPRSRRSRISLAWLSLFYGAGYLIPGGAALVVAPDPTLRLVLSTGDYGSVFPRAGGLLLLGLGLITAQIIRHRVSVLYPTTVAVHTLSLAGFAWLYSVSRDPFFAIVFIVVAVGVVLTTAGLIADWRTKG